jgi:hypothetical protein
MIVVTEKEKFESELADGIYVHHMVTKKLKKDVYRLFFQLYNKSDALLEESTLMLDLRNVFGVGITAIAVHTNAIKSRERLVFFVDVKPYQSKFTKFGWYLKTKCGIAFSGKEKPSKKKEDLHAVQQYM